MDETLIHTFRLKEIEDLCLFGVDVSQILKLLGYTCMKRPGVEEFLLEMSKHFILIPWTAGTEEYAAPILDWLDPDGSETMSFSKEFHVSLVRTIGANKDSDCPKTVTSSICPKTEGD